MARSRFMIVRATLNEIRRLIASSEIDVKTSQDTFAKQWHVIVQPHVQLAVIFPSLELAISSRVL